MGNTLTPDKPAERSIEWAVERAEKMSTVTRAVCVDGNYIEGTRSVSRDGDEYVYTNGENVQTFEDPQEAIDAFMG
tara:strand:- start:2444 stop:2671 length:228 start_codon:yes stop_codon:yes gene_type:complete